MAEVVSFVDYQPPQRFDLIPWTEVRIEESSEEGGTYVSLETIPLSPVDADPANPAFRSFTTELGTAIDYWYRIKFADADGDISQPTTPIQNTAGGDFGTAYVGITELQRVLRIDSPTTLQQDAMHRVLDEAAQEINWDLGLTTTPSPVPPVIVGVNLRRAVELWRADQSPFGALGIGGEGEPAFVAKDTWHRHHLALNAVRTTASQFGIA